jgi:hypothetical protein
MTGGCFQLAWLQYSGRERYIDDSIRLTAKLHAVAAVLKVLLAVETIDAVGVETEVASELGELDN